MKPDPRNPDDWPPIRKSFENLRAVLDKLSESQRAIFGIDKAKEAALRDWLDKKPFKSFDQLFLLVADLLLANDITLMYTRGYLEQWGKLADPEGFRPVSLHRVGKKE